MEEFLPLKNPGKKTRASLTKKLRENNDISKAKYVTKFRDLTQTSLPNKEILGTRVSLWNLPGLSNRVRTFILTLFYTRGLRIVVSYVMVPLPYRFSL